MIAALLVLALLAVVAALAFIGTAGERTDQPPEA